MLLGEKREKKEKNKKHGELQTGTKAERLKELQTGAKGAVSFEELFKNALEGEERQAALYGAGMVAVSVYYAIKALYKNCRILAFIVSEKYGNPDEIDGVPVITLQELDRTDVKILVAAPENHHCAIIRELERRNLRDYVCIDSRMEAWLMEKYYTLLNQSSFFGENRDGGGQKMAGRTGFPLLHTYSKGMEKASLQVYMAKFYKDKPIGMKYEMPSWMQTIQAGAALTDIHISDIRDDMGENISAKNVNYSELSAMYWVGKHGGYGAVDEEETGNGRKDGYGFKNRCSFEAGNECKAEVYLGLFHYRRILDVTEEDLYRIGFHGIDVILPYPTIHYPSVSEHHKRYLRDSDWEAMVQSLKETAPEYAGKLEEIFSQPYFYNYNMFIARQPVFKAYCDWLFPILERTEELSSPKGSERADRYIGYLGESLTTLYFMYHREDLKTAHTGRIMLV